MPGSREKEAILQTNGYHYNFTRMIYYNVNQKKIFSAEWVDDHTDTALKKAILEKNKEEWQFYFSGKNPSDPLKQEVIKDIKS